MSPQGPVGHVVWLFNLVEALHLGIHGLFADLDNLAHTTAERLVHWLPLLASQLAVMIGTDEMTQPPVMLSLM